jgi:hypothetical protein
VASTYDGTSVMVTFGRNSIQQSQHFLNHAFHFSFTDILYKQKHEAVNTKGEEKEEEK